MKPRALIHFIFLLGLASCGTATPPRTIKQEAKLPVDLSFFISAFDPPSSSLAALPATVNVTFSREDAAAATVTATSHFNLVCDGFAYAAAGVTFSEGMSSAAVALPSVPGIASGSLCYLIASTNIFTTTGVRLSGERAVQYRIQ